MTRYWYSVHVKAPGKGDYDMVEAYAMNAADISDLRRKLIKTFFTKGKSYVIKVYEYKTIHTPGAFIGKLHLEGSPAGSLWYTTIRPSRNGSCYIVDPRTGDLKGRLRA